MSHSDHKAFPSVIKLQNPIKPSANHPQLGFWASNSAGFGWVTCSWAYRSHRTQWYLPPHIREHPSHPRFTSAPKTRHGCLEHLESFRRSTSLSYFNHFQPLDLDNGNLAKTDSKQTGLKPSCGGFREVLDGALYSGDVTLGVTANEGPFIPVLAAGSCGSFRLISPC